jgi:diacylglycerol kinase family enzyme
MAITETVEARETAIADEQRFRRGPGAKARMLLIVNPMATTVSSRLKSLIAYALRSRYEVNAIETEAPNHAIQLTREATDADYDVVVAFGGDGTVNEAANGLAGAGVPLSMLPGGATNVVCRMLGIPTDVIDATEHLLSLADDLKPRSIDLGRVNGRYFVSSSGVGMDADTTRWVDEHPPLKHRAGPFFFSYASLVSYGRYLRRPVPIAVEVHGRRMAGISAVVQNSDPYTFFRSRPVRLCENQSLESGTLSMVVLRRASPFDLPSIALRLLSTRPLARHSQVEHCESLTEATVRAVPSEAGKLLPFPVQVDGDFIEEATEASFEIRPGALTVVA